MKKIFILIVFIILTLGGFSYWLNKPVAKPVAKGGYNKLVINISSIKKDFFLLEEKGFIKNSYLTLKLLSILNLDKKIKAGTYEINNQMSLMEIIEKFLAGQEETIRFTILEGHDLYDIGYNLEKKQIIPDSESFLHTANSKEFIRLAKEKLNLIDLISLEGLLYPDTYEIKYSSPIKDLLELSLDNFNKKIIFYLDEKKVEQKERMGYFIISSLIEKETIVEKEKKTVAGVVYNRLQKNMKLRFDPTIIYSLKEKNIYEENLVEERINIRRQHFFLASKFNTYYIKGLPPHPISTFTLSSLIAALNPEKHNFLFFVSKSKKNHQAGHDFSTTYEEHLAKIKKYKNK